MKLEDQVISIEYAKKLKELGVKQESLFSWFGIEYDNVKTFSIAITYLFELFKQEGKFIKETYSAFTVSELINILPLINGCSLQILKGYSFGMTKPKYVCRYDSLDIDNTIFLDFNLANSCAKILIYLIENGLIKNE